MRFILIASFLISGAAFAEDLDRASSQAVQETKALLGDPAALQNYAKDHPEAAATQSQVNSLTGGNAVDTAAVYKLAAEIFANMAKDTGGDTASMQKTLTDAMKNPAAFAEKLSPDQRRELEALTKSIESRHPTSSPH